MLVLSFSGLGEDSLTLASLEVLEHHPEVAAFDKIIIPPHLNFDKNPDKFREILEKIKSAEVVIWAVSPFHMNIPSHMVEFFERCRAAGLRLSNVNTFFQTNVRVCDNFLSMMLERQIRSLGGYFVYGLSYSTSDMVNKKMSLFRLSCPDEPPKKSLFGKAEEWRMGEGLKNAAGWIRLLQKTADILFRGYNLKANGKVIFVNMDQEENSPFVKESVAELKQLYEMAGYQVNDIAQKDIKISPCDGCKICYATKICKFKDSFTDYEKQIDDADIAIYYGNVSYGGSSAMSKCFIDRDVHNGLMPLKGIVPDENTKYKARGYVVDVDNADSYGVYKEYNLSMSSFSLVHFLGVCSDPAKVSQLSENDIKLMFIQSVLFFEEHMLPQRNFWMEKIGKHFADLSKNIPFIIPIEGDFYKRAGAFEPIIPDVRAKTVEADTIKIGREMRKIPYEKTIEQLDKMKR